MFTNFSNIDLGIKLYYIEEFISSTVRVGFYQFLPAGMMLTLVLGCITGLNPCLISMLPITLSYLSVRSYKNKELIIFLFGIINSAIIFIMSSALLKSTYHYIITFTPILSSIITIILGLSLMQIISFRMNSWLPKDAKSATSHAYFKNYFIGFLLGLSSSPCSFPILLTSQVQLMQETNNNFIYSTIYLIGYILPTILIIFIFNKNQIIKIALQTWDKTLPIGGSILLGSGIFSLLDKIFN